MDTSPAPLDALAGAAGLSEFRVAEPREIVAMLRELCDGNVPLNLHARNGDAYTTTIWTMDVDRGTMGFCADVDEPCIQALLGCDEVVVVGYLASVKLQFDVRNLVLVRGSRARVLSCVVPHEMFRFQRRSAYRVRPLMRGAPTARLAHPADPLLDLALRVLDVSIGGCALFLPDDVPPIAPGTLLERVEVDLDADTRFQIGLRVQHVSPAGADARGARLGCEFTGGGGGEGLRALQRFIDQTQKRGRLLSLN
jgi:c-di-GMP-binding flagellar brake protein YcgR